MAKISKRVLIQSLGAIAFNGDLQNFIDGTIHNSNSKKLCVPVLNCYSCPGAVGSCPIGSLQAVSNTGRFNISLYVLGLISLFGIIAGRFYCGYLCPFGFFQDLLYKIKSKKIKHSKIPDFFKYSKYIILVLFVFLFPVLFLNEFGISDPYFCKYICPSGTLFAGIPLMITNPLLLNAIGGLFFWKLGLAILIVIISVFLFRPFCKFLCPLGALFSLFNGISFYKFNINHDCISCGKCREICEYEIYTKETPNSPECIRCDKCINICPTDAIEKEFLGKTISKNSNEETVN